MVLQSEHKFRALFVKVHLYLMCIMQNTREHDFCLAEGLLLQGSSTPWAGAMLFQGLSSPWVGAYVIRAYSVHKWSREGVGVRATQPMGSNMWNQNYSAYGPEECGIRASPANGQGVNRVRACPVYGQEAQGIELFTPLALICEVTSYFTPRTLKAQRLYC